MLRELFDMAEGILGELHKDHEEVSGLIEDLLHAKTGEKRGLLFKEIASKLLAHAHAEQDVLYRAMKKSNDERARIFAYEGDNEHQIVEQQLEHLLRARNKASERWTAQATVLRDLIDHHVKEEEDEGFSCARREFDAPALEKLGEQFRRQKEKLLTEA